MFQNIGEICKFKKTENVADQPQSGPRRSATDEDTSAMILAAIRVGYIHFFLIFKFKFIGFKKTKFKFIDFAKVEFKFINISQADSNSI